MEQLLEKNKAAALFSRHYILVFVHKLFQTLLQEMYLVIILRITPGISKEISTNII